MEANNLPPQMVDPLFDHYKTNPFYKSALLARKALLRHCRFTDQEVTLGMLTTVAGIEFAGLSNDGSWVELITTFSSKNTLPALLNASQCWLTMTFETQDEYFGHVDKFVKMFEIQLAGNSLLSKVDTDLKFDSGEFKTVLQENPIATFILTLFLSGPFNAEEVAAMSQKKTTE